MLATLLLRTLLPTTLARASNPAPQENQGIYNGPQTQDTTPIIYSEATKGCQWRKNRVQICAVRVDQSQFSPCISFDMHKYFTYMGYPGMLYFGEDYVIWCPSSPKIMVSRFGSPWRQPAVLGRPLRYQTKVTGLPRVGQAEVRKLAGKRWGRIRRQSS